MKTALIIGALGQDGSYLTEFLLKLGYRVYGIVRKPPYSNHWAIDWMMSKAWTDKVSYIYGDMRMMVVAEQLKLKEAADGPLTKSKGTCRRNLADTHQCTNRGFRARRSGCYS